MHKILILEDDIKIRSLVKEYLNKYDFQVVGIDDFEHVEEQFELINPDAVLLDINLPYYDGFYFCRRLRKKSDIPIVIISARDTEMDQIMGMELGADDYIVKPFSPQRLYVKLKAILKRANEKTEDPFYDSNQKKEQEFYLDEKTYFLHYKNKSAELSSNEFQLLKKLWDNRDTIVSRDELLDELWGNGLFVDDNTLTVNVSRVKNKLKEVGIYEGIKTKRGIGYMFVSEGI